VLSAFDPGALLSHVYPLADGPRVRLRFVQRRDEPEIRALLAQNGREPEDFDVMRLVRFDPRRRAVICASALVGSTETLVGLGAIELGGNGPEPDLLVVDERFKGSLEELLVGALRGRANAIARTRAA
jgi:hypothetical protein